MTDNKIIEGLERCKNRFCAGCPFTAGINCLTTMTANALDLINRQKAEIERLKEKNESLDALVRSYGDYVTKTRVEAIKEFAERLKPMHKSLCVDESDWYYELDTLVKEMVGE